jgi:hypothetical protein
MINVQYHNKLETYMVVSMVKPNCASFSYARNVFIVDSKQP